MRSIYYSILTVTLLFGFSGCSSLKTMPNPFTGAKQEPRRSVAVWSPAARVANGVPERGFAARVTFFGNDSKKGVKVDGDIVVFAFDEYPDRSASDNAPDKTYPFLAEDLKHVHSYSKKLGHSYSLWVPWDNDGPDGERKNVSLIVKLVQKNGDPVLSGQAKCLLPGKEPTFLVKNSRQEGPISQVHYRFGRDDRFDEQLPLGFRDWTKRDIAEVTPEERQIRTTENRPMRMVKTSIPISGNAYSAIMQNNSTVSPPVEMIAALPQWTPQTMPEIAQYASEPNPIMPASYSGQHHDGQASLPPRNDIQQYIPSEVSPGQEPAPTDIGPLPHFSNPAPQPQRVEQQGNTTITYSDQPRTFEYGSGTNPLSRRR